MTAVTPRGANHADRIGTWAVAALGFSIPVSVALDNLLLVVVVACWIAGGNYRAKLRYAWDQPVFRAASALYGVMMLSILWSSGPLAASASHLWKYADLAFMAAFLYYLRLPDARRMAIWSFASAIGLILLLSILVKLQLLPSLPFVLGSTDSPVVFKLRITHSVFMAFGSLLFAVFAIESPPGSVRRLVWAGLSALAAVNVMLMVESATGFLVLGALIVVLCAEVLSRRQFCIALLLAPLILAAFAQAPGSFGKRLDAIRAELEAWRPDQSAGHSSSGQRLEFYRNTLAIVGDNPLLGTGMGGFAPEYAAKVAGTNMAPTANPHNEYLLIAAQLGVLGLLLFLGFIACLWRAASRLVHRESRILGTGLVATLALGCLFNSFLLDHAEGLFFAWMSGLLFAGRAPLRKEEGTG